MFIAIVYSHSLYVCITILDTCLEFSIPEKQIIIIIYVSFYYDKFEILISVILLVKNLWNLHT